MSKLNVLLAKTDQLSAVIKKNLTDAIAQFNGKQAHFRGERVIYAHRATEYAEPKNNIDKPVASTVKEWLNYSFDLANDFLKAKLDQESTNCSGTAEAELIIDGVSYGKLKTGELMALKGFFEAQAMRAMLEAAPTISLTDRWAPSPDQSYSQRGILESPIQTWTDKATDVAQEVKWDPAGKQPGVIVNVKNTIEKADVSRQLFTGEISHIDRANILARLTKIIIGIKAALETANTVEVVPSNFNAKKILDYLKG